MGMGSTRPVIRRGAAIPLFVRKSRSARARCAAAAYAPNGRAVASVRSPLISTLEALGGAAGALVTGESYCVESPLSTGTSVTSVRDFDSDAAGRASYGGVWAALTSLPSEAWTSEPMIMARVASKAKTAKAASLLRRRLSGGGTYAWKVGADAGSMGGGVAW